MKVLVTGGLGYVGSQVVRILVEHGHAVRVLDKHVFGEVSVQVAEQLSRLQDVEIVRGDIRHMEDLACAAKGVDAVIDLAAIVGDPACSLDEETTTEVNWEATRVILDMSKKRGAKRFVFASTCSVYGAGDGKVLDEGSPVAPVSLYARTKAASETEVLAACAQDFTTSVLRLSTVFGASDRMRFDLVVNIMTAKALREGRITLMNSRHWRPLVHVRDAARTFVEVVEASKSLVSGQVFNVGSDEQNYQIWRIAETVKSVVPDAVIYDAGEGTDSRSYRVGFNKISGVLGYRTTISVGEGVRDVKRLFDEGKIEDYRKDYYYNVNYPYK